MLLSKSDLFDNKKSFNTGLLEFGRDKSFLSWRFYSGLHEYAMYKKDNDDDYFVLRTTEFKGITCMILVDYRCNLSTPNNFEIMLKAVKKIIGKLRLSFLITASSIQIIDAILERYSFKIVGRPRPIISSEFFDEESSRIKNREFVLATLADSDGEILW